MIAKTVVLIFKGFMETADMNIMMTRKIIDIIHMANKAIAQGQMLANQAQEVGSSLDDLFSLCDGRVEDASERIISEAQQMVGWTNEIATLTTNHPDWSQGQIVKEAEIKGKKVSGTFELFEMISQNPTWTHEQRLEEAKKLNPNTPALTKVAEQDCEDPKPCSTIVPSPPGVPPDAWFDPIDETFIPEPQAWMISLAIYPGLVWPILNGIPFSNPLFGFTYWALDYKPDPNWLNGPATNDWLNQLFSKAANDATEQFMAPPATCAVDMGLPTPGTFDHE